VTAAVGIGTWPSYDGANSKLAIRAPSTAFISTTAMVFPMHACGPAMKERVEYVTLKLAGRFCQREGLNSSASGPQISVHVLITRIWQEMSGIPLNEKYSRCVQECRAGFPWVQEHRQYSLSWLPDGTSSVLGASGASFPDCERRRNALADAVKII
jgi:hypothetical protein